MFEFSIDPQSQAIEDFVDTAIRMNERAAHELLHKIANEVKAMAVDSSVKIDLTTFQGNAPEL